MGDINVSYTLKRGFKALFSITGLQCYLMMLPGFLLYNIGIRGYIPGSYKFPSSLFVFKRPTSIIILSLGFIIYVWVLLGVIRCLNYENFSLDFFISNLKKPFLNLMGATLIIGLIYSSFTTPFYLSQFIGVANNLDLALSILGMFSISLYIFILNPLIIFSLFFVVIERKNFMKSIKFSFKFTKGNRTKCIILNLICLILSASFISLLFILITLLELLTGQGSYLMFSVLIPGYLGCCLLYISIISEAFKQLTKK